MDLQGFDNFEDAARALSATGALVPLRGGAMTVRQKVASMEDIMLSMPQAEVPVKHYFSKGVCAREIFIAKGVTLTGRVHKYTNLNILSQGDISVLTEDGMVRIQAPATIVSPAGTKRIAYAHEDCVWTTIVGTEETDPELIELEFTTRNEAEFLDFCATSLIEGK
jgi:hypothetical protein